MLRRVVERETHDVEHVVDLTVGDDQRRAEGDRVVDERPNNQAEFHRTVGDPRPYFRCAIEVLIAALSRTSSTAPMRPTPRVSPTSG